MRGVYLHIPFCRQACRYCDFYFSVSLHYQDEFVDRLVDEIRIQGEKHGKKYEHEPLDTLYLGGGTPSLLSRKNLEKIMEALHRCFSFREDAEISIECNPDDLNPAFLNFLRTQRFNRLSIGIQSFHERDLQLMRRSHHSEQAEQSLREASSAGFKNISIDLIYGIPGQSTKEWEENVSKAMLLPISHLSAYHLTFEPGTVFDHWRKKGRLAPVHEAESLMQYNLLRERLKAEKFEHYEISNFGLPGLYSRHNMIYWGGLPYLGLGPSAHSFDGMSRSWNIASIKAYMKGIALGSGVSETENLSRRDHYHDYLITSLRTKWGADPELIYRNFGDEYSDHFHQNTQSYLEEGSLYFREGKVAIHPERWLITDHILKELFMD